MASPNRTPVEDVQDSPDFVRELLVEVFLARGAAHHGDLDEAVDEFRELLLRFGILTEENEALIHRKVARLERRAGRSPLRLVGREPSFEPDDER